jgi:hypothetical protein
VARGELFRNLYELHGHQTQTASLQAADDCTHQATLYAVWLDDD